MGALQSAIRKGSRAINRIVQNIEVTTFRLIYNIERRIIQASRSVRGILERPGERVEREWRHPLLPRPRITLRTLPQWGGPQGRRAQERAHRNRFLVEDDLYDEPKFPFKLMGYSYAAAGAA